MSGEKWTSLEHLQKARGRVSVMTLPLAGIQIEDNAILHLHGTVITNPLPPSQTDRAPALSENAWLVHSLRTPDGC